MTYEETTQYLFKQTANYEQQGQAGYKAGLDNSLALDDHYGHPHQQFKSIHVAGTNGKGSCSHMLAAILQRAGYRVGLYTSPHLVDFCERIRVDGEPIPQSYVVDFVEEGQQFFESLGASFFEITTAMAFKYFAEKNIDIAVVEVGLGGRLDSTNIITPIVSLITNISLDHTDLLGSSLEQIAMEKGGIIKKGVPVIVGETTPETRPIFEALAQEVEAPIVFAEEHAEVLSSTPRPEGGYHYTTRHLGEFDCELGGFYQPKNMNTVLPVLNELVKQGYLCNCEKPQFVAMANQEMNEALTSIGELTGLSGRWQKVKDHPTVVCDTGHNVGGWEYLSRQIAEVNCSCKRIVFGMLEDKDVYGVMSLLPKDAVYYFCRPVSDRALPEQSVQVFGQQIGLSGQAYPDVKSAYEAALNDASSDDFIFVGGSNYIVADFLKLSL
jgi:dihydrofolate synthase/folylpolyglutamate synthase